MPYKVLLQPMYFRNINNSQINEIISELELTSLTSFLFFILELYDTPVVDKGSINKFLTYREALLEIIKLIETENNVAIGFCYHALYIVSCKLSDKKQASFYLKKRFEINKTAETPYRLRQSLGLYSDPIDFQQAIDSRP